MIRLILSISTAVSMGITLVVPLIADIFGGDLWDREPLVILAVVSFGVALALGTYLKKLIDDRDASQQGRIARLEAQIEVYRNREDSKSD